VRHTTNTSVRFPVRQSLRLGLGVIVPVAAYLILSSAVHSSLTALAVTEAIPLVWVLAIGLRRHRVEPMALVLAVVLAAAVVVSLAAGGTVLPLKLRRAVITGSLGIACLASVAARRPLLPAAVDWLVRVWPRAERLARVLGAAAVRRAPVALTLIVGLTLLADATAQVALSLTVSTAAFLGTSRLARIAIFATGIAASALYVRHAAARDKSAVG
jgi:hypothetical protein